MKELDYTNKEALRKYVGRPIIMKRTITSTRPDGSRVTEPAFLYVGELRQHSGESLWLCGPFLMEKYRFREMCCSDWPLEYTVFGNEYIPHSPHMATVISGERDPDVRVFSFESDTEGLSILGKIKNLEETFPIA